MTTIASIFTGGALWEVGARDAGLTPLWGVEIEPAVAAVAERNLGHRMVVADALALDPASLEPPDVLVASPPCQAHSVARSKSLAPRSDADVGRCVVEYARALKPRAVLVENVPPYADSPTFKALCRELMAQGYWCQWGNVNAADFGIAQTRRRLILRAVRDGLLAPLPPPVPWRGWYDAIADLIPTLPESRFAEWQLRRLGWLDETALVQAQPHNRGAGYRTPDEPALTVSVDPIGGAPRAFLVNGTSDAGVRDAREPAQTVNATLHEHGRPPVALLEDGKNSGSEWGDGAPRAVSPAFTVVTDDRPSHWPRAFIAHPTSAANFQYPVADASEPVFTITGTHGTPRAWLEAGRVVKLTPRALARFQSFPDWYELPAKTSLATKIIGNAIPCLLARRLLESVAP